MLKKVSEISAVFQKKKLTNCCFEKLEMIMVLLFLRSSFELENADNVVSSSYADRDNSVCPSLLCALVGFLCFEGDYV